MQPKALRDLAKKLDEVEKNETAIKTQRFYNSFVPTYITRPGIKHDSFLILKWGTNNADVVESYTDKTDNEKVDIYLFKSIEDQKKEGENAVKLKVKFNTFARDTFLEIYEIQNQEKIGAVLESYINNTVPRQVPDWETLAKENVMITKATQLEKGKYYKFVMDNFDSYQEEISAKLHDFEIKANFSSTNQTLLLRTGDTNKHSFCAQFSGGNVPKNMCDKFKYSE